MPTYSQIEPDNSWLEEVEEIEDALMELDGSDFSELDALEEEGY